MKKTLVQLGFIDLIKRISAALALCFATLVSANPQILNQARAFVAAGNSRAAFDVLSPLEDKLAGQVEFDVLYGAAAADAGQVTRAIFALSRATERAPSNAQAHLELARALWLAGERNAAKRGFARAKMLGLPTAAEARFSQLLSQVPAIAKPWNAFIDVGLGYDGNTNSGINARTVVIPLFGDLDASLSDSAARKRSGVTQLAIGGDYTVALTAATHWRSQALIETKAYENARVFNNTAWQVQTGALYKSGATAMQLSPYFDEISIQSDAYRRGHGGVAIVRQDLHSQLALTTQLAIGRNHFVRDPSRDNTRRQLSASLSTSPSPENGVSWRAELSAASEKPHDQTLANLGYNHVGARAGAALQTAKFGEWQVNLGYEQRRYRGEDILFLRTRQDRQSDLRLTWRLPLAASTYMQIEASALRNQSNIALNDYTRTLLLGSIRHLF